MLLLPRPNLSVIIATSRPQWLANCLHQYKLQHFEDLNSEVIVVAEGDKRRFEKVINYHKPRVIYKEIQGRWGAFAKDIGIEAARGDYVCFWDDDNIYYHNALITLYRASWGFDVGIVRARSMYFKFNMIPRENKIQFGNIDTMNFCIRREIAKKAKWSDHTEKGTDFAYINKIVNLGISINWSDACIGEKLFNVKENV